MVNSTWPKIALVGFVVGSQGRGQEDKKIKCGHRQTVSLFMPIGNARTHAHCCNFTGLYLLRLGEWGVAVAPGKITMWPQERSAQTQSPQVPFPLA